MATTKPLPKPSSGTEGFFQQRPHIRNQFEEDITLRRIADFYLPEAHTQSINNTLTTFASAVLAPDIYTQIASAERNPPTLSTHSTFGHPRSILHTSSGWRNLCAFQTKHGLVAEAYDIPHLGHNQRIVQFLKAHIWEGSSAIASCPIAMADGAARLLSRYVGDGSGDVRERVFREALRNLTSREVGRSWTSGQWMTERAGGSDVRGTESVATFVGDAGGTDASGNPLGPWSIDGFKWFSSATDSDMTILLAQTTKGLTAFYAPMRQAVDRGPHSPPDSELNGITIQRLKPKLGTRAVPTAELVLKGTRAWMVGEEGKGTREIATVLNVTRVHTALSALGLWGRGLAISRAFARVRTVAQGKLLKSVPAHVRSMAKNRVDYGAMMQLGYFAVATLGISEHPGPFDATSVEDRKLPVADANEAVVLGRLICPVAKAMCSKHAVNGLQECMESLGGIGYLEDEVELNIARLYRDANVNTIWEGTTDVMAEDVVRVLKGRDGDKAQRVFDNWVKKRTGEWGMEWARMAEKIDDERDKLGSWFSGMGKEELAYKGRDVLEGIAWIVAGIMLVEDARRDGDRVATEIARRWILQQKAQFETLEGVWKRDVSLDQAVAFPPADEETVEAKL